MKPMVSDTILRDAPRPCFRRARSSRPPWSVCGAERSQLVATTRKWVTSKAAQTHETVVMGWHRLPQGSHGKEGSAVRVIRQKRLQIRQRFIPR
jgi:hypothetical protein